MVTKKNNPTSRAILKILDEHGPVTMEMIKKLLPFEITKSNLRRTMTNNRKKDLINVLAHDSQTFFYELNQSPRSRQITSKILGKEFDAVKQDLKHHQNWHHHQWCEFWINLIKRHYPEAEIIREDKIPESNLAKNILLIDNSDLDLLPDFLFFLKISEDRILKIAFEIERTRKSEKRLLRKFKKYAEETKIDGLVCICDSGRLSDTVRLLYADKLMTKSDRIGHFGNIFLLLSNQIDAGFEFKNSFFNALGEPVDFKKWTDYLSTFKLLDRKNVDLKSF